LINLGQRDEPLSAGAKAGTVAASTVAVAEASIPVAATGAIAKSIAVASGFVSNVSVSTGYDVTANVITGRSQDAVLQSLPQSAVGSFVSEATEGSFPKIPGPSPKFGPDFFDRVHTRATAVKQIIGTLTTVAIPTNWFGGFS
jgi:hypothetical protein